MVTLHQLEEFMRLLHAVQNVERVARIPDETKLRNTAEHTFELAMLAWYLSSTNNLDLDLSKILQYALAHDLIEAYTGDIYAFDTNARKKKAELEREALQKITEKFQEFPELITIIEAYEKKEDEESKFVYSLDKLIDPLNASMETRSSIWKERNISYQQLRKYKDSKIAQSDMVMLYYKALCAKLETNKDFFFDE